MKLQKYLIEENEERRKAWAHLTEGLPLDEAVRQIQQETRRFAKRQLTWLRRDPGTVWVELPAQAGQVERLAKKFLNLA